MPVRRDAGALRGMSEEVRRAGSPLIEFVPSPSLSMRGFVPEFVSEVREEIYIAMTIDRFCNSTLQFSGTFANSKTKDPE
jgi:hypothetical protein